MISASSAAWEQWAPEAAESIMPTCGMSRQGLLAGAKTDTHKKSSLKGGRTSPREEDLEKD